MTISKEKLRYAILTEVDKKTNKRGPDSEIFGVSEDLFFDQVTFLYREGYMNKPMYADDKVYMWPLNGITEKGEKYLKDNSTLGKTYSTLKEIRDWIKL